MGKYFIRPSAGLFFGIGQANKDQDRGTAGAILGNIELTFGALLGGIIGFGEKWGLYTGLSGALSLLPFLGFGFIGIPIGFHIKRSWGFGIIIPIWITEWYIGLIVGGIAFALSWMLAKREVGYRGFRR